MFGHTFISTENKLIRNKSIKIGELKLIEILNKKISILEYNQKSINNIKNGVIYVLQTDLDIENIY